LGIRRATWLWLMLGVLCAPLVVGADDSLTLADLSRGDRVRVRLSSDGSVVQGTIDATGPDAIVVRPKDPAGPPVRLSPPQLAKLEVVRGRRSRWRGGAVIGFAPGFVLGGLGGLLVWSEQECDQDCDLPFAALGYGLVGGAITGTLKAPSSVSPSRRIGGSASRMGDPRWP